MMPLVRTDPAPALTASGDELGLLDLRELVRARHLLETHSLVHDLMAREAPLGEVLAELVRGAESQSDGMLGSILLFDAPTQTLLHGAAPNLPPAYCTAVDGTVVGPGVGSCGSAAHAGREVIVDDINRDPRWRAFRGLAAEHGLGACWSVPIADASGAVLGTFALYYSAPRVPDEGELALIRQASRLAAIAIERDRSTAQLRQLATHDSFTAGAGDTPQAALRRADSALYDAKRNGVGTRLYNAELRHRATDQLQLDAALRRAIARDELSLHYQPSSRSPTAASRASRR